MYRTCNTQLHKALWDHRSRAFSIFSSTSVVCVVNEELTSPGRDYSRLTLSPLPPSPLSVSSSCKSDICHYHITIHSISREHDQSWKDDDFGLKLAADCFPTRLMNNLPYIRRIHETLMRRCDGITRLTRASSPPVCWDWDTPAASFHQTSWVPSSEATDPTATVTHKDSLLARVCVCVSYCLKSTQLPVYTPYIHAAWADSLPVPYRWTEPSKTGDVSSHDGPSCDTTSSLNNSISGKINITHAVLSSFLANQK